MAPAPHLLPPDDALRRELHDEVHARPPASLQLPALVTFVAVLNADISRDQEAAHLRVLPGQAGLTAQSLEGNFLRLHLEGYSLKWERHSEFTRYSIVQPLAASDSVRQPADVLATLAVPSETARSSGAGTGCPLCARSWMSAIAIARRSSSSVVLRAVRFVAAVPADEDD